MKRVFSYLKPYRSYIILAVFLIAGEVVGELLLPEINANIINYGVTLGDTAYIWDQSVTMLLIAAGSCICAVLVAACAAKVSSSVGRQLRHDTFAKVESFTLREVNHFGNAGLITRTTNDITQVQNAVQMAMRMMLFVPIMLVASVVMALRQDISLSAVLLVAVPVIGIFLGFLLVKTIPLFNSLQGKIDRLNLVMREKLAGVRVIRAFIKEGYEEKRFDQANRDVTQVQMKAMGYIVTMMPVLTIVMNFSTLAVYWFGGRRIEAGLMPVGNLTAFMTYIMHILFSVMMSTMMFVMLPRAAASFRRVGEVLDTEPSGAGNDGQEPLPETFDSLEFRDVTFRYPNAEEPVLSHISFTVRAGETLAIIGSTGSGKSTLISLIPRLYDVTEGQVLYNGVDVRQADPMKLRDRLGYVPQKAFLMEGTIASNLRYGKDDATEEEMWHALEVAQGKDFVEEKPEGLESEVAQGGANLSGGQRQRMAIARALIRKPQVYVFDDSFSALDFKTDARLRAALKEETRGAAVIIVAQRVSTIMTSDNIVVLDNGHMAGMGKHEELMKNCQVYREIVLSQLSEEEVAS